MKRSVYISVPKKTVGSLSYLVIGHSALAPGEFLRPIMLQYKLGILLIGIDAPSLLNPEQSQRLVNGMQHEGVSASITAGFPWVSPDGIPKMCEMESYQCQGDALLLKTQPVDETFECSHLPCLSGFNKDKLRAKDVNLLNTILSSNDIYVRDELAFAETLIVTKNTDILQALIDEVEYLQERLKK
jgi:hypothetical protein